MANNEQKIAVVGAGLAGSMVAAYLAQRGYQVTIYERRPDPRLGRAAEGRSINLALSNRGWRALRGIGLHGAVADMAIPMNGRMMHATDGALTYQPYGRQGEYINSVSRGALNQALLAAAERAGATVKFSCRCLGIDHAQTVLAYEEAGKAKQAAVGLVIGADGAFSAVRGVLQRTNRFDYAQQYLGHGYKELTIPPGADGGFALDPGALHIWPRKRFMLIALPNLDKTFTCTLFLPFEGEISFETLRTPADVQRFFAQEFPDVLALMPGLAESFAQSPAASLVTVSCFPWHRNRTVLMGDASHAIVPFYGQGMNAGFEDCRVFDDLVGAHGGDWDTILPEFERQRKPDADAISQLALQNYIEMRDLVGDASFLLRKRIEARLHELYPDQWVPLYSMVTFRDDIRYSEALRKGAAQQQVMAAVMQSPGISDRWENLDYAAIVAQLAATPQNGQ